MDQAVPSTSTGLAIDENYILSRQNLLQKLQSNYPDSDEDTCFPDNPQRKSSSEDNAQQLIPDPRLGNNRWCKCGHCLVMYTSEECVCCQEIPSVALEIPEEYKRIADIHYFMLTNQPIEEDISVYHRNLRSFTSWIHGFLGIGVRIAIPSCAVAAVREAFPDPKEKYVGFIKVRDYCAMDMAFDL
ncbi:hypothetical protein XELAEV_18031484mg [Xenopus laevis]|uniref:P2X purinoreceptor 7 intracellular domain-containing protein n=1 Tax=Xenopus laevis TaxID=8355 RepID=A0A974CNW5_XENLA|nr:hypothetical protein XELAEV_18031484mg [Xenopus laevis]